MEIILWQFGLNEVSRRQHDAEIKKAEVPLRWNHSPSTKSEGSGVALALVDGAARFINPAAVYVDVVTLEGCNKTIKKLSPADLFVLKFSTEGSCWGQTQHAVMVSASSLEEAETLVEDHRPGRCECEKIEIFCLEYLMGCPDHFSDPQLAQT